MRQVARSATYASLVLASLVVLVPLVVVLFAAFKTHAEYATTGPLTPPDNWLHVGNFVTAWTGGDMLRGFWNTTVILAVSLTGTVAIGTLSAYALISTALFRFKGPYGAQWETIAACTMIVILPTVVIFLLLQRLIDNGITAGATK